MATTTTPTGTPPVSLAATTSAGPVARRPAAVLAVLCLAVFAVNDDTTIVNVALPALVRQLGAMTRQLQWVVDAYLLVFAALVLAGGSLSDRLGRRAVLVAGLAVFGLGKAGVGSAVNDATREIGGTLGVAVIGSVFASPYTARLGGLPAEPAALAEQARGSVGTAFTIAAHLPASAGSALRAAASNCFYDGLHAGCLVASGVALLGAAVAALALPARPIRDGAADKDPTVRPNVTGGADHGPGRSTTHSTSTASVVAASVSSTGELA